MKAIKFLALGAVLAAGGAARAEPEAAPSPTSYGWHEPGMVTDIGVGISLGGGVGGFTDQTMRDVLRNNPTGDWGVRATIGSHVPLGVDVSYLGSAGEVTSLMNAQKATLVGTGFEAALRYNILPHYAWNPYVFAGLGYQRYDITGASFQLSDTGMNDSNNLMIFPMGAGLAYRAANGIIADVHGTYRPAEGAHLVQRSGGDYAGMHTWEAGATLGYEF